MEGGFGKWRDIQLIHEHCLHFYTLSTTVQTYKQFRYLGWITNHPKIWWLNKTLIFLLLWIHNLAVCWRQLVFFHGVPVGVSSLGIFPKNIHFEDDHMVLYAHSGLCTGRSISPVHGPFCGPLDILITGYLGSTREYPENTAERNLMKIPGVI